jgi:hypothetical protein
MQYDLASSRWHLKGLTGVVTKRPNQYMRGHRRWLRRFQESILSQAQAQIQEDLESDKLAQDSNHLQSKRMSAIHAIQEKPAWALTEAEAAQKEDAENQELIAYASTLDFDKILEEIVETSTAPDTEREEEQEDQEKQTPDSDSHVVSNLNVPLVAQESARVFFFDSQPLVKESATESLFLPTDSLTVGRKIVVSDDVRCRIPALVSTMPYLRLCPSV